MINLKELADLCGVSIATISNTLNGKSNVSESTKKRIMEKIKETGYQPNTMARKLRSTNTRTVAIIVEDVTAFGTAEIINGVMDHLESKNYESVLLNMRLYNHPGLDWRTDKFAFKEVVDKIISEALSMRIQGIVYVGVHTRELECFEDTLPVPLVITYSYPKNNNFPHVIIDDEKSARELAQYLVEKGAKNIACIAGLQGNHHTTGRLKGLVDVLSENGITFDQDLLEYAAWMREDGYEACKKLMAKGKKIDAIFCQNDLMAGGVYDWCDENGITIGQDLLVTGFDNREFTAYLKPPLTTMELPHYSMAWWAGKFIIDQIEHNKIYENRYEIQGKLIER